MCAAYAAPTKIIEPNSLQALTQVFSVPERIPLTAEERSQLESASRFEHRYPEGTLAAWTFGVGPRVVLVHGWSSRGAHLLAFVGPLIEAGYSVTLFDAPAHGDSTGEATSIVHVGRALLSLCAALGDVQAIVAHSAGSAASLWAFNLGLRVERSVHLSGPSSLTAMLHGMAANFGLVGEEARLFTEWVEAFIGYPPSELDLEALKEGLHHSGLILHDIEDRVVPYAASEQLHQAWPGSRLVALRGQGHKRLLGAHAVVTEVAQFLTGPHRSMAERS